jgi:4-carboxymuconolactone decarboxylase
MRIFAAVIVSLAVIASLAQAQERISMPARTSPPSREDVQKVAPALHRYTQERLLGDVWKRPGLNTRDRSIVTLAALIAHSPDHRDAFLFESRAR